MSVFHLVHGLAQRPSPDQAASSRTVNDLVVPPGLAGMQGRARVDALRLVLDQAGVSGEVDFVRHLPGEHRLIVPVRLPNRDTVVSLDYEQRTAMISSREHSLGDALVYPSIRRTQLRRLMDPTVGVPTAVVLHDRLQRPERH